MVRYQYLWDDLRYSPQYDIDYSDPAFTSFYDEEEDDSDLYWPEEEGYWGEEDEYWDDDGDEYWGDEDEYYEDEFYGDDEYWPEDEYYEDDEYWHEDDGYWEDDEGYWEDDDGYWEDDDQGYYEEEQGGFEPWNNDRHDRYMQEEEDPWNGPQGNGWDRDPHPRGSAPPREEGPPE